MTSRRKIEERLAELKNDFVKKQNKLKKIEARVHVKKRLKELQEEQSLKSVSSMTADDGQEVKNTSRLTADSKSDVNVKTSSVKFILDTRQSSGVKKLDRPEKSSSQTHGILKRNDSSKEKAEKLVSRSLIRNVDIEHDGSTDKKSKIFPSEIKQCQQLKMSRDVITPLSEQSTAATNPSVSSDSVKIVTSLTTNQESAPPLGQLSKTNKNELQHSGDPAKVNQTHLTDCDVEINTDITEIPYVIEASSIEQGFIKKNDYRLQNFSTSKRLNPQEFRSSSYNENYKSEQNSFSGYLIPNYVAGNDDINSSPDIRTNKAFESSMTNSQKELQLCSDPSSCQGDEHIDTTKREGAAITCLKTKRNKLKKRGKAQKKSLPTNSMKSYNVDVLNESSISLNLESQISDDEFQHGSPTLPKFYQGLSQHAPCEIDGTQGSCFSDNTKRSSQSSQYQLKSQPVSVLDPDKSKPGSVLNPRKDLLSSPAEKDDIKSHRDSVVKTGDSTLPYKARHSKPELSFPPVPRMLQTAGSPGNVTHFSLPDDEYVQLKLERLKRKTSTSSPVSDSTPIRYIKRSKRGSFVLPTRDLRQNGEETETIRNDLCEGSNSVSDRVAGHCDVSTGTGNLQTADDSNKIPLNKSTFVNTKEIQLNEAEGVQIYEAALSNSVDNNLCVSSSVDKNPSFVGIPSKQQTLPSTDRTYESLVTENRSGNANCSIESAEHSSCHSSPKVFRRKRGRPPKKRRKVQQKKPSISTVQCENTHQYSDDYSQRSQDSIKEIVSEQTAECDTENSSSNEQTVSSGQTEKSMKKCTDQVLPSSGEDCDKEPEHNTVIETDFSKDLLSSHKITRTGLNRSGVEYAINSVSCDMVLNNVNTESKNNDDERSEPVKFTTSRMRNGEKLERTKIVSQSRVCDETRPAIDVSTVQTHPVSNVLTQPIQSVTDVMIGQTQQSPPISDVLANTQPINEVLVQSPPISDVLGQTQPIHDVLVEQNQPITNDGDVPQHQTQTVLNLNDEQVTAGHTEAVSDMTNQTQPVTDVIIDKTGPVTKIIADHSQPITDTVTDQNPPFCEKIPDYTPSVTDAQVQPVTDTSVYLKLDKVRTDRDPENKTKAEIRERTKAFEVHETDQNDTDVTLKPTFAENGEILNTDISLHTDHNIIDEADGLLQSPNHRSILTDVHDENLKNTPVPNSGYDSKDLPVENTFEKVSCSKTSDVCGQVCTQQDMIWSSYLEDYYGIEERKAQTVSENESEERKAQTVSEDENESKHSQNTDEEIPFVFQSCLKGENDASHVVSLTCGCADIDEETMDILAVCTNHSVALWRSKKLHHHTWELLHTWWAFEGEKFISVQLLFGSSCVGALVKTADHQTVSYQMKVYFMNQLVTATPGYLTQADHVTLAQTTTDRDLIACTVNEHEVCMAWTAPESSQLAKFALNSDLSEGHIKVNLHGTESQLKQLTTITGIPAALLGADERQFYIWNHDKGVLLRKITLSCPITVTACLPATSESGLLFVPVFHSLGACLLVLNPTSATSYRIHTYENVPKGRTCTGISRFGEYLSSINERGELLLWNIYSGRLLARQHSHHNPNIVCTSHSGKEVLLAGTTTGCVHWYAKSPISC